MLSTENAESQQTAMGLAIDIESAVHGLKVERDTWREVAQRYKAAFEAQTARLQELQAICVVTQAELENERSTARQLRAEVEQLSHEKPGLLDGADETDDETCFGSAVVLEPSQIRATVTPVCSNPCFKRVEQFASQCDYGTALKEVDRLLRGPLTSDARAEGLLLKSSIMEKSGPEWLYDALAACSEALELCDRLGELRAYLPRIQYQRGVCYYQLRMFQQARNAFAAVREDDALHAKAMELRRSCEEELDARRRPAFEERERRTVTEGLLAEFGEARVESKRRRTSAQLRLHASKAKRMSLPHRWVASRPKPCGVN